MPAPTLNDDAALAADLARLRLKTTIPHYMHPDQARALLMLARARRRALRLQRMLDTPGAQLPADIYRYLLDAQSRCRHQLHRLQVANARPGARP